jgi:hypothetical protein
MGKMLEMEEAVMAFGTRSGIPSALVGTHFSYTMPIFR